MRPAYGRRAPPGGGQDEIEEGSDCRGIAVGLYVSASLIDAELGGNACLRQRCVKSDRLFDRHEVIRIPVSDEEGHILSAHVRNGAPRTDGQVS